MEPPDKTSPTIDPKTQATAEDAPPRQESVAAQALAAAGDAQSAEDVGALDRAFLAAQQKLGAKQRSLVERLIYGPAPDPSEFVAGSDLERTRERAQPVIAAALECLERGEAFTADQRLSDALREQVAAAKGYGFTVPAEFGGLGGRYEELAVLEEELAANGLGALAVEISGELTIGAGSILGYGTEEQRKLFLPMLCEGRLMGFGLTEVGVGVNAKKLQAYVEPDPETGGYRLFARGERAKLWITNAAHGALLGVVCRIGRDGERIGLFVVELPDEDVTREGNHDYEFKLESSGVSAFGSNYNSKITFDNFPIPKENEIQADGVEVLFYCLRMGRCMLSAMSAGYQRMFAADAIQYARARVGVGGKIIKHELPRLAIGKILGGALQSRALAHLALEQDAQGVDLGGLRDLTKSAAASTALSSLIACERVLGGRTFDENSRISQARPNMHVFGVVEGEDDLIRMGMVKDVTAKFVDDYLAGMLSVINDANRDAEGNPLPREERILRITPGTLFKYPGRSFAATLGLLSKGSFWRLAGWVASRGARGIVRWPLRWIPARLRARYQPLPPALRPYAAYAERRLEEQRWVYLALNLFYQLELTRTQIPLQRFAERVENLVAMLAVVYHAAAQDSSEQRIAQLQAELLRERARSLRLVRGIPGIERLRASVAAVAQDVESDESTLVAGVKPEPYAHPWSEEKR